MRQLADGAGISVTSVSDVIQGNREATWGFCAAIAKPLQVSPVRLFRMAGLLDPQGDDDITFEELQNVMGNMTRAERENVLKFAWFLIKERGVNYDTDTGEGG